MLHSQQIPCKQLVLTRLALSGQNPAYSLYRISTLTKLPSEIGSETQGRRRPKPNLKSLNHNIFTWQNVAENVAFYIIYHSDRAQAHITINNIYRLFGSESFSLLLPLSLSLSPDEA